MSALPISNFTIRITTGTNVIAALGDIFVESPGGHGPPPSGNAKRAIVFVILSLLLMLLP